MLILTDSLWYSEIANAIRARNADVGPLLPSEMAQSILDVLGTSRILHAESTCRKTVMPESSSSTSTVPIVEALSTEASVLKRPYIVTATAAKE